MENLNVVHSLNCLCNVDPEVDKNNRFICALRSYLPKQIWSPADRSSILNTLTEAFLCEHSNLTLIIAKYFSAVILELLYRAKNGGKHKQLFIALSKLIGHLADVTQFTYNYFENSKIVVENLIEKSSKKSQLDILIASLNYLCYDKSLFQRSFDCGFILEFLDNEDVDIRWITFQCYAMISDMNNSKIDALMREKFSNEDEANLRLKYLNILNYREPLVNLNNIDFSESEEIASGNSYTKQTFSETDISSELVSVCGVLIPKLNSEQNIKLDGKEIIQVSSVKKALRSIAISVVYGQPILVQGTVGSGKTSLIEYLGALTNRFQSPQLVKVQMGDQIDSKSLIGSYCCTDIPGEFIWKPGPLTTAMINGNWLIIEDIDCAPADVMTMFASILETKSLSSLPGCANLHKINSDFRLFFTRRLLPGNSGKFSEFFTHSNNIDKLCNVLTIEPFPREEMLTIISQKYESLKPIAERILEIFDLLQNDWKQTDSELNLHTTRTVSFRDLIKWCERISKNFKLNSEEVAVNLFLDANDCLLQCIPAVNARISKAELIGVKLNISKSNSQYLCAKRKPDIKITDDWFTIGRMRMKRETDSKVIFKQKLEIPFFAFTHQSLSLVEKVAAAVCQNEPVLLCGETGTGKTSSVQYLAHVLGNQLTVINMNQQSDSCDLLGGYKPVEARIVLSSLRTQFEELFSQTFQTEKNAIFLSHISATFQSQEWEKFFKLISHVCKSAQTKSQDADMKQRWKALDDRVNHLMNSDKFKNKECLIAFSFIEGSLVKAIKEGSWILLDEINLAESETLQCLSTVLDNHNESLQLLDIADGSIIKRHKNFRLFACMNPATDIGKKELPLGIRNRFTEFFVEELEDKNDLQILVDTYLQKLSLTPNQIDKIVEFYLRIRNQAKTSLCDTTGAKPHYSLRTLCRSLIVAASNPCFNIQRSLYEAFCLSFLTQLDRHSHDQVKNFIEQVIFESKNLSSICKAEIEIPLNRRDKFEMIEGYWIPKGEEQSSVSSSYILTASVKRNLKDLSRVISIGKSFPILIQGETSVGKTSMIQWLANATGNRCVRVNNHEHTDLQEYIGTYCVDSKGKLVFKEGVLIEAMRRGYWIILDELNLAPTEVLEALNRVLDDNRELFIAETQQLVKAHPKFLLFATQNPPGHYGGRKILSRAFRNRFVELHFDEIPSDELEIILHKRCALPLSYAKRMVGVLLDLQIRRSESGVFAGKHGYITLRDLFRWGERYRKFSNSQSNQKGFYDWDLHLAKDGYMLLAGRVRKSEEALVIKIVLEKRFRCKLDYEQMFDQTLFLNEFDRKVPKQFSHIVWTSTMKRLGTLLSQALKYGEPVLLVGETGCGKTTICQLFALLNGLSLYTINCHMHSESADFLGSLRPVRNFSQDTHEQKLFEWVDGPLINAMNEGAYFLVDEISLADDSVLERLNSVLEYERTLLLAEKASELDDTLPLIIAKDSFRYLATMNPGGDFGKKELSPALRNRFTEIWCPPITEISDVMAIIEHNLNSQWDDYKHATIKKMCEFMVWFSKQFYKMHNGLPSIRDVLSWIEFMNITTDPTTAIVTLPLLEAFTNGAQLVFVDAIGTASFSLFSNNDLSNLKRTCYGILEELSADIFRHQMDDIGYVDSEKLFGLKPFYIKLGPKFELNTKVNFTFECPTSCINTVRLLRAMQLPKPILLEGAPGVGKTTLVQAIAKSSGYKVVRINLSEQTDISDLFGADLPVEGEESSKFAWRDGPLLSALKSGNQWIILDELNLASQSVLEGLNACLDHRSEIFISELNKTFKVAKGVTRIFACQNPHVQGGARKGLPRSFLNRFTNVFIDSLTTSDMEFIVSKIYNSIPNFIVKKMVRFNQRIIDEMKLDESFGNKGSPWDFNLRDLFRWCEVILQDKEENISISSVVKYCQLIYANRMRTEQDKEKVCQLFKECFADCQLPILSSFQFQFYITSNYIQVGHSILKRSSSFTSNDNSSLLLLNSHLEPLETLMKCIEMNWMAILVGTKGVGKSSIVHLLAHFVGHPLKVLSVNQEMDTLELLGGFEQKDLTRKIDAIENELFEIYKNFIRTNISSKNILTELINLWFQYSKIGFVSVESQSIKNKLELLSKILDKLKQAEENEQIKSLNLEINSLKSIANNDIKLNGSFEWIDSILVNSLKQGNWLLIDNVNLCSASVLDRLNALLEPNGVLTINERGSINGKSIKIKPHPDFRLILAMDPANGELSRPMRNRGVEMNLFPIKNDQDIKFLMKNEGIDNNLCDLIYKFYKENSSKEATNQNLVDLLESEKQFIRKLQHGLKLKEILEESFSNFHLEESIFDNLKHLQKTEINDIFENKLTSFNYDSTSQMVLQDSCVFEVAKKKVIDDLDIDLTSCDQYLCESIAARIFIENSSINDISIRRKMLNQHGYFNLELFHQISNNILKIFNSSATKVIIQEFPLDFRQNVYLWNLVSNINHLDKDQQEIAEGHLNCWHMNLFWQQLKQQQNFIGQLNYSQESIKSLSEKFIEKKISSDSFPEIVFKLSIVLKEIEEKLVKKALELHTKEDDFMALREMLLWIHQLNLLCNQRYPKKKLINEVVADKFIILWTLTNQKAFNVLQSFLDIDLTESIKLINNNLPESLQNYEMDKNHCKILAKINENAIIFSSLDDSKLFLRCIELYNCILMIENKFKFYICYEKVIERLSKMIYSCFTVKYSDYDKLLKELIQLEDEVKSVLSLKEDLDEEENQNLLHAIAQRELSSKFQISILYQLAFSYSNLNSFIGKYHPNHYKIDNKLCLLNPQHIAIKIAFDNHCYKTNELMLSYYHDYNYNMKISNILKVFNEIDQAKDNSGDKLMCQNCTAETMPLVSFVTSKLLSDSNFNLGMINIKKLQLESLQQFLSSNFKFLTSMDNNLINDQLNFCSHWYFDMIVQMKHQLRPSPSKITKSFCFQEELEELKGLTLKTESFESLANKCSFISMVGLATCHMLAPTESIDPVQKSTCKLDFYKMEFNLIQAELALRDGLSLIKNNSSLENANKHPIVCELFKRKRDLEMKMTKLSSNLPIRPIPTQYYKLYNDVKQFLETLASQNKIRKLIQQFKQHYVGIHENNLEEKSFRHFIQQSIQLTTSISYFIQLINKNYILYKDLLNGFMIGTNMLLNGIKTIIHLCESALFIKTHLKFDNLSQPNDIISFLGIYCNSLSPLQVVQQIINSNLVSKLKNIFDLQLNSNLSKLMLSALQEVENQIILSSDNEKIISLSNGILNIFVESWKQAKDEEEERKLQEEALFQYKTKVHEQEKTQEELDQLEVEALFPSFMEHFNDLVNDNYILENESTKPLLAVDLDDKMAFEIAKTHMQIINLLNNPTKELDFKSPFILRYLVISEMLSSYGIYLNYIADNQIIDGHLIVCHDYLSKLESSQEFDLKSFNIYYDSSIQETSKCLKILQNLQHKIAYELLNEFPNHPTLTKLLKIIDRIFQLPIDSPLIKFVTGLEVLLEAAQDWQMIAHKGITLSSFLDEITQLIISWRKIELKFWSNCLDSVTRKYHEKQMIKWWFYLFINVNSILNLNQSQENCHEEITQFASTIKSFIQASKWGEFFTRLELISIFISHVKMLTKDQKNNKILNILNNLYNFYKLFSPSINDAIENERKPIEKELKEFVTIAQWNDMNFWSMKQAVEKSHRTLHRFMKKFESLLNQPVKPILTINNDAINNDAINEVVSNFQFTKIFNQKVLDKIQSKQDDFNYDKFIWLQKCPRLINKSKKHTRKLLKSNVQVQDVISYLDDFANGIITEIKELNSLKVDVDPKDKEKWKKGVNHIQNRKRRRFNDLLKILNTIGLSYRKGLIIFDNYHLDDAIINVGSLNCDFELSSNSENLIRNLSSCNDYFYKCFAKYVLLKSMTESPSKDLTLGNVERIKGISAQLMKITIEKRQQIFEYLFQIKDIKEMTANLLEIIKNQERIVLIPKKDFEQYNEFCEEQIIKMISFLCRFKDLFQSFHIENSEPKNLISTNYHFEIHDINIQLFDNFISKLFRIQKEKKKISSKNIYSIYDLHNLKTVYDEISVVIEEIVQIEKDKKVPIEYLMETIRQLNQEVKKGDSMFRSFYSKYTQINKDLNFNLNFGKTKFITEISKQTTALIKHMLFTTEKLFKYFEENKIDDQNEQIDVKMKDAIQFEQLKQSSKIFETQNFKALLTNFLAKINQISSGFSKSDLLSNYNFCSQILPNLVSLIEIWSIQSDYFLQLSVSSLRISNKILYILLGLFNEISQKGFCKPPELEDDSNSKESGTEFHSIEDGGFGDGQGSKNVSDKVQDESQLDDTVKEESKNDDSNDNDIDDEDGIEMNDDFDGKSFSPSKKDDNESDEESGDEDENNTEFDKQMGEIDNEDEDFLDEKIWGSDNDSDNDDSDIEDADYDGGDEVTESKLVAKDENKGLKDDDKQNDKKEKKPEQLNDEINEADEIQNDEYEGEHVDPYKNKEKDTDLDVKQEFADDINLDGSEDENEDKEVEEQMSISGSISEEDEELENVEDENKENDLNQDLNAEEEMDIDEEEHENGTKDLTVEELDDKSNDSNNLLTDNYKPKESNEPAYSSDFQQDKCNDNVETTSNEQAAGDSSANDSKEKSQEQHGFAKGTVNESNNLGQDGQLISNANEEQEEFQNRPNQKDKSRRTLSNQQENVAKRQKILENDERSQLSHNFEEKQNQNSVESSLYQHVDDETKANNEVSDLANDEQGQRNQFKNEEGKEIDKNDLPEEPEDMNCDEENQSAEQLDPLTLNKTKKSFKKDNLQSKETEENLDENKNIEIEGENVITSSVSRGPQSSFHTKFVSNEKLDFSDEWLKIKYGKFDNQSYGSNILNDEALNAWKQCEIKVAPLVYELCEQLQLVLEPTKTGKLKGDYRNGKRLNMRKMIAYIASQFRKDKIWLRRTKPSKRQYQIVLAIDDSLSMSDNKSKQLAFESFALLGKSLSLLEAGELAIFSFGQVVRLLHPFGEPFSDLAGARILNEFKFDQNQTKVAELLESTIQLFTSSRRNFSSIREISQLLLIVSDGRGLFSEGEQLIRRMIRMIRDLGIFMVFVILDDPKNKDSILDIRVPIFDESGNLKIETYMEKFPFPYYIILRDINSMPLILGEALRQWFELILSTER